MWIRGLWALLLSIGFHLQALYFAQTWLARASVPPVPPALLVHLEPIPEAAAPDKSAEMNTLEDGAEEAAASAQRPAPPVAEMPRRAPEKLPQRLSDSMPYPPEALAQGLGGETILAVDIDAKGRIVQVSIVSSSGYAILDDAALRFVRGLKTLGPEYHDRSVLFPVRFDPIE